ILDLVATVESLETIGVPILGIGHNTFPRFVERSSEQDPTIKQVDDIAEVSAICNEHWRKLGFKSSVLATTQVPHAVAIDHGSLQKSIAQAEQEWAEAKLPPPTRTPFLLDQLAKITGGKSLIANFELLCNNALVASKIAVSLKVTTQ
ncbi:MAG: pseudouridine-5'-phosphate glycosidase, partial [Planctomycetota bacterium]|nr:pseudouridine-5'-phosphate glycosidase [Planctomycetota bacterium]